MLTYSPDYKRLQQEFHVQRPDYGCSGHKYADAILGLARSLKTESVLDYGCGKCTLAKALPFPIANYDPFIPEFHKLPGEHFDIVVCTDVMEHVEEEFVKSVLDEIQSLADKLVFFQIATAPAQKVLPDGRNAHITIRPASWWLPLLCYSFEPLQFENHRNGFVFIGGNKELQP